MAFDQPNVVPAGFEAARQLFQTENLPLPYIPATLEPDLREISPWVYGTRADTPTLYDFNWFVEEVQTRPVADYVLFGHAGHGINSWAMHYFLVWGGLALFIQSAWGGAYMDKAESTQTYTTRLAQSEMLFQAVQKAHQQEHLPYSARLIVAVSDFYKSRWLVLPHLEPSPLTLDDERWQEDPNTLTAALKAIRRIA